MDFAYGETVDILRDAPGGTDPYGDPIEGEPTETPVEGCAVWAGAAVNAETLLVGREPVTADRVVAFPAGTVVLRTDRLRIRGAVYDVEGEPFEYVNPFTGWRPGVIAYANRGEG